MKTIHVLCVNDYHAQLSQTNDALGCAKLVTAIQEYRSKHSNTIVVFGGDNHKGDPISEAADGHPVTELMRYVGTVASALGNHEFEVPIVRLFRWEVEGFYQYLAANLIDTKSNDIPAFVHPYQMIRCGDVLVAILGLSTIEPLDKSTHPPEMRRLRITDGVEAARYWISFLKRGGDPLGRPDAIIALTHYGLITDSSQELIGDEMINLCNSGLAIDGAFAAHWHQFMAVNINGIPVAQGGSKGQGFAVLTLRFDDDRILRDVVPSFESLVDKTEEIAADCRMLASYDEAKTRAMRVIGEVIGFSRLPMPHRDPQTNEPFYQGSKMSALVLQSMMDISGCEIALMSAGWIGDGLKAGSISKYDIWNSVRFNGDIVKLEVRGDVLMQNISIGIRNLRGERMAPIAVSGLKLVISPSRPVGQRLISATLMDGQKIEFEKKYKIVTGCDIAENMLGFDFSTTISKNYLHTSLRSCIEALIQRVYSIDISNPQNVEIV